jgi:antirestriction protein ArdC
MLNKTQLIGNVGADVETRYTKTQVTVATFRVATTERWKDNDGKAQEATEWHRIVAREMKMLGGGERADIVALPEDGVNPWAKPWQAAHCGPFSNALTNRPYRGMNVLLLNLMALSRGHVDPRWLTYRNAEQLGGHVRKGEKGAAIIFWKFLPARDRDGEAEADTEAFTDDDQQHRLIPVARVYTVFNAEQCEGLALPSLFEDDMPEINEGNEPAEKVLALPNLKHGGSRACYLPGPDLVLLPKRSNFEHDDFYFCTGYHETLH